MKSYEYPDIQINKLKIADALTVKEKHAIAQCKVFDFWFSLNVNPTMQQNKICI
ncbi:MAG: hypothetical protein N2235_03040 [Fischerella sp.]|nr:hypothetical protein [Fischerella sp.]